MSLTYKTLHNTPESFETINRWWYDEWAPLFHAEGIKNNEETLVWLKQQASKYSDTTESTPLALRGNEIYTIVGFLDGKLCATAGIVSSDFPLLNKPDPRTPFLCTVYVGTEFRGKGYYKQIVQEAMRIAKEKMGYSTMYLWTHEPILYQKLGWKEIEQIEYATEGMVHVMQVSL